MPDTVVQSFRLIASKMYEMWITQTFHSVLTRNRKISESKNAVILSKMIFFLFKKEGAHLQYA